MNILVTGSSGFIGSQLCPTLSSRGYTPHPISRTTFGDITPHTHWLDKLKGVDCIIHLASRVHIMKDSAADPLAAFRHINTAATLNLANQAAQAGVRRFIFLSSIKVNGETTQPGQPFTASTTLSHHSIPPPSTSGRGAGGEGLSDPYALSKHEAEQGLRAIAQQTGLEIVIIRPPLVYGSEVKANFLQLMHWLRQGIPLPLGSIHNHRSLVALPNLIDLIITCIDHPAAANQTFLVSDGEDLSTTQLLQRLSAALDKPTRLLPIPQKLLEITLTLLGKRAIAQRLCGNLQVDISKTRDLLGWNPPVSVDEALRQTAQAYLQSQR